MTFLGKVEVVDTYEHELRSVSLAIKAPAVVRLINYIHIGRRKPPLSRINLLARDEFTCQYCKKLLSKQDATIDHVIPKSKAGKTTWQNCVISCSECNRKKGSKTLKEARMKLLNKPEQPDWLPILSIKLHKNLPQAWLVFLK